MSYKKHNWVVGADPITSKNLNELDKHLESLNANVETENVFISDELEFSDNSASFGTKFKAALSTYIEATYNVERKEVTSKKK